MQSLSLMSRSKGPAAFSGIVADAMLPVMIEIVRHMMVFARGPVENRSANDAFAVRV